MSTRELPSGSWSLNPAATTVTVTAKNFLVRSVPATLAVTAGQAIVAGTLSDSSIQFSLAAGSFDSGNAKRDQHVRTNDFLDAERHPSIDFRSQEIASTETGYRVTGLLRLAESSTTIVFDINDVAIVDGSLTFRATAVVDRRQVGVAKMPSVMIGNKIDVAVVGAADRAAS